jgi:predicted nucleic acid-binding protein
MLIALDTNMLIYAERIGELEKQKRIIEILTAQPQDAILIPAQCLLELINFLRRKMKFTPIQAAETAEGWAQTYKIANPTPTAINGAINISKTHQLQPFDAYIFETASQHGCNMLLSEDMQHGFKWRGTTIINPFENELQLS